MRLINITLLAFFVILTSCVSKKKYDEMVYLRERAVRENRKLNQRYEEVKRGFSEIQAGLSASNAKKDGDFSALEGLLNEQKSQTESLKNDLEETKQLYSNQKNTGASHRSRIEALEKELKTVKDKNVSLKYSLDLAQERSESLGEEFDRVSGELQKQESQGKNVETLILEKDKEIKRLEAQTAVQQRKLDDIKKNFVALRKDLIRLNVGSLPKLDPNKDSNVKAIDKSLGM